MRHLFGCPDIVSLTEKFLMARFFFRIFTENNPVMGYSKTFFIPEAKRLKRCQGCVKLIASNCFLNINDLSEVQLCMSSNSWTWECPHTKDGADHVPLIFLSSVYCDDTCRDETVRAIGLVFTMAKTMQCWFKSYSGQSLGFCPWLTKTFYHNCFYGSDLN